MRGLKFSAKEKEKALKMWLVEKKGYFLRLQKEQMYGAQFVAVEGAIQRDA